MKKTLLTMVMIMAVMTGFSQVEHVYDFNSLSEGTQNLNGQDGWVTHYQTAAQSQDFNVAYTSDGLMSPDESIAIFYPYGGPGVGRTATRKASGDFDFNFQSGGIIDLEFDLCRNWWGAFVGVGFDSDNDGNILDGMTDGDGGVSLCVKGADNNENHPILRLPSAASVTSASYQQTPNWARYKLSFDFNAFDGAGSVTVFVKEYTDGEGWGEWQQIADMTELNMGLTPGSGDKNDYKVWDGIYLHSQGATGAFDNILVRQMPDGNVQYINMPDIPKQLTINGPITLQATATSGLPVSFEYVSGPATLNGNVLTLTGDTGEVKIKATQGGDATWLPAPEVIKTFLVIDPMDYTPTYTIRRPFDGSTVYMPELNAMVICVSAYVEHSDAIEFEEVKATIDGSDVILSTMYPEDKENGYFYGYWTPDSFGSHDMDMSITTSGGKVTTDHITFEVSNTYDNMNVTTMNGDLVVTPSISSSIKDYEMPLHVGAFNDITANYQHNCVGSCDTYDRVGGVRVRNYRGEWMELFRYITPFGVECEADLDVTDYTSVLQGIVEFELFFETWSGDGYNPTLTFEMTKGAPEYKYANVEEIWYGTFSFGDYANQQPVPTVGYSFDSNTEKASVKVTTTGHNWSSGQNGTYNTGNAAEFLEATHHLFVDDNKEFDQHNWENCNPNPFGCQPQNGTWTYPRSGWCPGSIAMVWDFDISSHINKGSVNLFYQFDPNYIDECHPNYPDCVDGQNGCPLCNAPDNPILKLAGKVITYSNDIEVLSDVNEQVVPEAFDVALYPNPAQNRLNLSTDYEHGNLCVLILNAQGQIMANFAFSGSRTIDVSGWTPGVYFVQTLGGTMKTQKVVIK
ncbi:MAG: T9SS type A sorting domain-containing protein [bacterium]|nr:T9SS type A sorting domain-containing protein [Candidatus Limimorpha caballi]